MYRNAVLSTSGIAGSSPLSLALLITTFSAKSYMLSFSCDTSSVSKSVLHDKAMYTSVASMRTDDVKYKNLRAVHLANLSKFDSCIPLSVRSAFGGLLSSFVGVWLC